MKVRKMKFILVNSCQLTSLVYFWLVCIILLTCLNTKLLEILSAFFFPCPEPISDFCKGQEVVKSPWVKSNFRLLLIQSRLTSWAPESQLPTERLQSNVPKTTNSTWWSLNQKPSVFLISVRGTIICPRGQGFNPSFLTPPSFPHPHMQSIMKFC